MKDSTHQTLQSTQANPVLVFSGSKSLPFPAGPFPSDMKVVLTASRAYSNTAGLAVYEAGAKTQSGTAAGRRAWLGTFDVVSYRLKPDVQTLYRDVVLWAGSSSALKTTTTTQFTTSSLSDFFNRLSGR